MTHEQLDKAQELRAQIKMLCNIRKTLHGLISDYQGPTTQYTFENICTICEKHNEYIHDPYHRELKQRIRKALVDYANSEIQNVQSDIDKLEKEFETI